MHGLGECVGNIMMMCAKHNIPTVEQYMGYSNCIMEKFRGAAESNACAAMYNVDYTPVSACVTSLAGQELLVQTGLKQQTLSPALASAPWILIDNVFTEEQMMAARADLRAVVCAANEAVPRNKC
ncbi:GILT-like protein C02D5.2 [Chionoecetes opilio]|uniref:GILT-like protein C02D5.2 n=1 Tax=Chionoecetes opilio TaxID=41210 RepID=A0A8J4YIB1_CHIOP|nr:GILT-like protein C02D5.2 [Chionoecetes opilio]